MRSQRNLKTTVTWSRRTQSGTTLFGFTRRCVTPAMESGIVDHLFSFEDLVESWPNGKRARKAQSDEAPHRKSFYGLYVRALRRRARLGKVRRRRMPLQRRMVRTTRSGRQRNGTGPAVVSCALALGPCVARLRGIQRNLRTVGAVQTNYGQFKLRHSVWYNFIRTHKTLSVTPTMESGIVDRLLV
jgi:hypothetical protein